MNYASYESISFIPTVDIRDGEILLYGRMEEPQNIPPDQRVGARIGIKDRCSNCGRPFTAGEHITADLAPAMTGVAYHTDCMHPTNPCGKEEVPSDDIDRIVGIARDPDIHYGRAVSAEQTIYILHPYECLDTGIDLRGCPYSAALDRGVEMDRWDGYEDAPVELWISAATGRLVPIAAVTADDWRC